MHISAQGSALQEPDYWCANTTCCSWLVAMLCIEALARSTTSTARFRIQWPAMLATSIEPGASSPLLEACGMQSRCSAQIPARTGKRLVDASSGAAELKSTVCPLYFFENIRGPLPKTNRLCDFALGAACPGFTRYGRECGLQAYQRCNIVDPQSPESL